MAKTFNHSIPIMNVRDADLGQIDALWDLEAEYVRELRPSDRHSFRQAFYALDRLGERLMDLLSPAGAVGYRALPQVSPATRFRTIPKNLWLEILFEDAPENPAEYSSIFVEFIPNQINFGLFVSGFSSDQKRKEFWKDVRSKAPDLFQDLKCSLADKTVDVERTDTDQNIWCVSKNSAPTKQPIFNADLNDWMRQKSKVRSEHSGSFAIRKSCNEPNPSFDFISTKLANAVELFQP